MANLTISPVRIRNPEYPFDRSERKANAKARRMAEKARKQEKEMANRIKALGFATEAIPQSFTNPNGYRHEC